MSAIRLTRNDVGVIFVGDLSLPSAVNWTGAVVYWKIQEKGKDFAVVREAGFTSYGTGTSSSSNSAAVRYISQTGDLSRAGDFWQEWEVQFADGSIITFPNGTLNEIRIRADLGESNSGVVPPSSSLVTTFGTEANPLTELWFWNYDTGSKCRLRIRGTDEVPWLEHQTAP